MKKDVKIGERMVPMKASAFTPFLYKEQFGRDIITEMQQMQDSGNVDSVFIARLGWVFAKSADPTTPGLEEWLDSFELFDLYMASAQIIELWALNNQQNSKPVKK